MIREYSRVFYSGVLAGTAAVSINLMTQSLFAVDSITIKNVHLDVLYKTLKEHGKRHRIAAFDS